MTTYGSSFTEQRYIIPLATLRRDCLLPSDVRGTVIARTGQRVESTSIVARGQLPARHYIVEAAELLRLRRIEQLSDLLLVEVGDDVEEGQPLAGKNPKRGRRAFSPIDGQVAAVEGGRIIVREYAEEIQLVSGMVGYVASVYDGRGIVIETAGAVVQGVWGNNRRAIGVLRLEPDNGMEFIQGDSINTEWRGAIVVTRRPLTPTNFVIMEDQDIAAVIAPSMDASLYDLALQMNRGVLLTEGFGDMNMSNTVYNLLEEIAKQYVNVQAIMDAIAPSPLMARQPEVLINVPIRDGKEPRTLQPSGLVKRGAKVRLTQPPYTGQTATVRDIPDTLVQLPNGMRVTGVEVETAGGEIIDVPLTNIELFAPFADAANLG